LLALVVLIGLARGGGQVRFVAGAPLLVSAALALYAYERYGDCEYCLWKAATFMLPFVAVGLAAGAAPAAHLLRGRGATAALLCLAAIALVAVARSDVELSRATYETPARTSSESRGLTAALNELGERPRVLIEGADATVAPLWTLPEAYALVAGASGTRISIDPGSPFARTFNLGLPPRPPLYAPTYRHVVTTFPGLVGDRRPIARHGIYSLVRRAPIDVALMRPGWALDPGERSRAGPWLQGPFQLWVSGPATAQVAVTVTLGGPLAASAGLSFAGRSPGPRVVQRGRSSCVEARLDHGLAVLRADLDLPPAAAAGAFPAVPGLGIGVGTPLDPRLRPTESDPISPPPKRVRLVRLRAERGGCR
jgi:hypothetical protein